MLDKYLKLFRPDLIMTIKQVGEAEAFWANGYGMICKLISAIAKVRPRLSRSDQAKICLAANSRYNDYDYHALDETGRLTDYELRKFEVKARYRQAEIVACEAFAACDTGKEEFDLLCLTDLMKLMFGHAGKDESEIPSDLLLRMEKYYVNNLRAQEYDEETTEHLRKSRENAYENTKNLIVDSSIVNRQISKTFRF